jgi:hypothetical protein
LSDIPALWTKGQCEEAYDELMIKIALSSYAEIDGRKSLDENKRLKSSPQFTVTPEVESKIRRTVNKTFTHQSVSRAARGFYKATSKVAVVFLVFAILFSTTVFASSELRSAIYKLVFTHEKEYTLIEIDSATALEFVDSEVYDWDHAFAPTIMPQGYAVSDMIEAGVIHVVIYENDNGGTIIFHQDDGTAVGSANIDTEDAQLVQTIFINDSEGLLVSKDGYNQVAWRIGNSILTIESGSEDSETLIAIAKGIKLLS